jgi:hypothetical protein
MKAEQDKWKKLTDMAEEYGPNFEIPDKAIQQIETRSVRKMRNTRPTKRKVIIGSVACSVAAIIGISLWLPTFFAQPDEPKNVYYASDQMEYALIGDMDSFVAEHNLNIFYYSYDMENMADAPRSQSAQVIGSDSLAYIAQNFFCIGENGFDVIELTIVLLPNAEFDFLKEFDPLPMSLSVSDIEVSYTEQQGEAEDEIRYLAKFNFGEIKYFLKIDTADVGVDKVTQYVDSLIN